MPATYRKESLVNPFNLPRGEPLRRAVVDVFRRQRQAIDRYLRTGKKDKEGGPLPPYFPAWHDWGMGAYDLSKVMTPILSLTWSKAGNALAASIGFDTEDNWSVINPHTAKMIDDAALAFCDSMNATTSMQLDAALAKTKEEIKKGYIEEGEGLPDLTKRLQKIWDGAEKHRARRIAQTETSRAAHSAQEQTAIQSGVVTGWRWLISSDACPICVAIAARAPAVKLGHAFAVIGDNPHYSQIKFPPAHPHCNCSIEEVLDTDPQPKWHDTLHQPGDATDAEIDQVAKEIEARDNATLMGSFAPPPLPPKKPSPSKPRPSKPRPDQEPVEVSPAIPRLPDEPIPPRPTPLEPPPATPRPARRRPPRVSRPRRVRTRPAADQEPVEVSPAIPRAPDEPIPPRPKPPRAWNVPTVRPKPSADQEPVEVSPAIPRAPDEPIPARPRPPRAPRKKPPKQPGFSDHEFGESRAVTDVSDIAREKAAEIFGRPVRPAELASIAGAPHDARVSVRVNFDGHLSINVEHPSIEDMVRTVRRVGDKVVIHNDIFRLNEEAKGSRFGLKCFATQVENAQKAGVSHFETNAYRDDTQTYIDRDGKVQRRWIGYYVWPAYGYDGPIPAGSRAALKFANLPARLKVAKDIRQLMAEPAGREWWQKNGIAVDVEFDLKPGSYSMEALDKYLQLKMPNV